jgi:hypothetical protein
LIDPGSADRDSAALRLNQRVDAAQDRGLAGTGRTDDRYGIAPVDGEVDALQHLYRSEGQMHVFQFDEGVLGGWACHLLVLKPP